MRFIGAAAAGFFSAFGAISGRLFRVVAFLRKVAGIPIVSVGNAAVAIQPMTQQVATPRSEATPAIDFEARFQQAAAAMAAKQKNRI